MIQTVMLVALGFLLATLIFLLVAPVIWRRAGRIATRRLKQSLPISLTDFHAEKDQLRARHAMEMRKLEVRLQEAKDKTAHQLVEIGRQKAENMVLARQIRELRSALSERKSLISVMEQTLNANVPRLKERMESEIKVNMQLSDTIAELEGNLDRKTRELEEVDRDLRVREAEIRKLRHSGGRPKLAPGLFSFGGKGRSASGMALDEEAPLDLSALDLKETDKAAGVIKALQQENRQLRGVIEQTRDQLGKARAFEEKEVPLLRKEMRQLSAELLRKSDNRKQDAAAGLRSARPVIKGLTPAANGGLDAEKLKQAKSSLADRLKSVSKLVKEADA